MDISSTGNLSFEVYEAPLPWLFQEKNCRKGRFCSSKLKGKRVIELGAGCGVAGFGMALLGCDVVSTDQVEVLPLLMHNIDRNTSRIKQMDTNSDSFGSIEAAELNWGNKDHIRAVDPPFDYIIGTDIVYAEHLMEPLLKTIFALSGPKTTILWDMRYDPPVFMSRCSISGKEIRSQNVPKTKVDKKYQHPSIQLYIMGLKPPAGTIQNMILKIDQPIDEVETAAIEEEDTNKMDECASEKVEEDSEVVIKLPEEKVTEWETRRLGSMAARLLRDVKIT